MENKLIIILVVVLVALLAVFLVFADDNPSNVGSKRTFNVSSGAINVHVLVDDIRTFDSYEGYDNKTVEWMEALGDKYAFVSSDEIVIMGSWDAHKIPDTSVCDADCYEIFSADVIENRSLGSNLNNTKNVVFVKNVDHIKEQIIGNGLA